MIPNASLARWKRSGTWPMLRTTSAMHEGILLGLSMNWVTGTLGVPILPETTEAHASAYKPGMQSLSPAKKYEERLAANQQSLPKIVCRCFESRCGA